MCASGGETILFCEDSEPVRKLGQRILADAGYKVLVAACGAEAIALAAEHQSSVALLLTDVVLPDINGRAVSEALRAGQPDMLTLYISGYPADVIGHHGVLDAGVQLLEKPFTRRALLARVRAILDAAHPGIRS
jgi:two-component system cell cycle sensor histidine kinase/response regulator CckA